MMCSLKDEQTFAKSNNHTQARFPRRKRQRERHELTVTARDLLISSARLDVDKLDFTLDERWLTPLQTWLMHISGQGAFGHPDASVRTRQVSGFPSNDTKASFGVRSVFLDSFPTDNGHAAITQTHPKQSYA